LQQTIAVPRDISVHLLTAHPENSNFMDEETIKKLRRHIERTGRYEPLTVRPHPSEGSKFQVINGHNRLRVLRALGHQVAQCVVWDLNDDQTRLYLSTLNRLSGHDVLERRASLLENLMGAFDVEELASLLPDDRKQLEELKRLSCPELDDCIAPGANEENLDVPVFLSFVVEESEAKEINLALDLILRNEGANSSRSRSLVCMARYYLRQCGPILVEQRT